MTTPWKDYPSQPDAADEPYEPSPLTQALGGGIIAFVIILALCGAGSIIHRLLP